MDVRTYVQKKNVAKAKKLLKKGIWGKIINKLLSEMEV